MTLDFMNNAGNNTNNIWKNISSGIGSGFKSFINSVLPWTSLIDTGIGLISGISNNIYDRQLQERLFQRDDTSLDRTMQMYQRNGINPLMSLPGASAGNTKGFEPTSVSSNLNQSYLNFMQKKQLGLTEEKMWLDNAIAKEDLDVKRNQAKVSNLKATLESKVLKAKLNGFKAYAHDYYPTLYSNYDLDYSDVGIDPADGNSLLSLLVKTLTQVVDDVKNNKMPSLFEVVKNKLDERKAKASVPKTTTTPHGSAHSSGTIPRASRPGENKKHRKKNYIPDYVW